MAIKMIRVSRNISLAVMNDIFKQKESSRYNLRQISEFSRPLVKSVYDGSENMEHATGLLQRYRQFKYF